MILKAEMLKSKYSWVCSFVCKERKVRGDGRVGKLPKYRLSGKQKRAVSTLSATRFAHDTIMELNINI
jgi:hypothetical protein